MLAALHLTKTLWGARQCGVTTSRHSLTVTPTLSRRVTPCGHRDSGSRKWEGGIWRISQSILAGATGRHRVQGGGRLAWRISQMIAVRDSASALSVHLMTT